MTGIVSEVQSSSAQPYKASTECRKSLYDTLIAIACAPKHEPVLLQKSIHLFQLGLHDTDFEVIFFLSFAGKRKVFGVYECAPIR